MSTNVETMPQNKEQKNEKILGTGKQALRSRQVINCLASSRELGVTGHESSQFFLLAIAAPELRLIYYCCFRLAQLSVPIPDHGEGVECLLCLWDGLMTSQLRRWKRCGCNRNKVKGERDPGRPK